MRTTVLVPLHASARWLPVVTGTLERLAPHARLLVSDATGLDDTLPRLRERFGDLENIDWVGPRPLRPGWVVHCNDLVERSSTEFVMWMPHDDETDAAWVTLGERALDGNPAAVLALGRLRSLEHNELGVDDRAVPPRIAHEPHPPFLESDAEERVREALRVCLQRDGSLLGMAFRGVFRRESAVPLPDTGPDGAWADKLWAIGMLSVGSFAATEAVYWKRWYDGNTHRSWADLRTDPALRAEFLPAAVAGLPEGARSRVLGAAWAEDTSAFQARVAELEARRHAAEEVVRELGERVRGLKQAQTELRGRLGRSKARNRSLRRRLRELQAAEATRRPGFEESAGRLTAPLRRAARTMRGRGTLGPR